MKKLFFTLTILLAVIVLHGCSGTDNDTLPTSSLNSEVQLAPGVFDETQEGAGKALCADLTDEQRQQINDTVAGMKETGATRDEINVAVKELMEGFGIEVPDDWREHKKGNKRQGRKGKGDLCADLTDEQRQQIKDTVAEMKEAGATRDEINAAVKELLEGFGVEVPDDWGEHKKGNKRQGRKDKGDLFADLTDEQRQQIEEQRQQIAEMKEAGATRDEIKAAVEELQELLEGFGIEVPDDRKKDRGKGRVGKSSLTDEQRQQIDDTVAEMKEAGATRDEIKVAVEELLKGFGIEVPDDRKDAKGKRGKTQEGRKGKRG